MAVPGWVGTAALLLLLALTTRCNDDGPADVIPPATIPQNPPTSFGAAYKVAYNEINGSSMRFPDISNIPQVDFDYFGEKLDFESIDGHILIGAADKLYLLDSNLTVTGDVLSWPSDSDRLRSCDESFTEEDERPQVNFVCRNHIRLYERHPTEDDLLYVCGSQAATMEQCRGVEITPNGFGEAQMPRNATTSIISTHPDYVSFGEFRRLNANDTNYISWTYTQARFFEHMFNEQSVSYSEENETFSNRELFTVRREWFTSGVRLVDMISASYLSSNFIRPPRTEPAGRNYDYYFLFLREVLPFSLEFESDTEPLIISRVVRVCRDDPGVLLTDNITNAFSTFLKARIFCNQRPPSDNNPAGAVATRYNDLWSVALNADTGGRTYDAPAGPTRVYARIMYGAFSTTLTGPTASVICAYHASAFDGSENDNRGLFDTFIEDVNIRNTGVAAENAFPFCDGTGRPAVNPTGPDRISAEDTVISRTMQQIQDDPLIVVPGVYITQMVVDEVCVVTPSDRDSCLNQDIIFAGTDKGTIIKIFIAQDLEDSQRIIPVIAEEISLDDSSPVKELRIEDLDGQEKLYAVTSSHVYKLTLERCSRHKNLTACVGSRDPYCVWNTTAGFLAGCQRNRLTAVTSAPGIVPPNIQQNIFTGVLSELVAVGFKLETYTAMEGTGMFGITVESNGTVPLGWLEFTITGGATQNIFFDENITMLTINISVPADSRYTGVQELQAVLRNTQEGMVFFTKQQATVRVIDDDGILAQVGLVVLGKSCSQLRSQSRSSLPLLDNVIKKALNQRSLMVQGVSVNCFGDPLLANAAVYRLTITADIDIAQLQSDLSKWTEDVEGNVKASEDTLVIIEPSCNTRILTEDDDLCIFQQVPEAGVSPRGSEGLSSPGGVLALVFGLILALAVVVIIGLSVALWLAKREKTWTVNVRDSEIASEHEVPNGTKPKRSAPKFHSPEHAPVTIEDHHNGANIPMKEEQKKDLTASHSSSDSSQSQSSPVGPVTSAAPLVVDGVESKKNPFQFALQKAPFGRRDSPRDSPRISRASRDSPRVSVVDSGHTYTNSVDNTTPV